MKMVDFTTEKESYTRLKLMLIKIAAMLNEDRAYTREKAFYDIMKAIIQLEESDIRIKDILRNSTYGDHLKSSLE